MSLWLLCYLLLVARRNYFHGTPQSISLIPLSKRSVPRRLKYTEFSKNWWVSEIIHYYTISYHLIHCVPLFPSLHRDRILPHLVGVILLWADGGGNNPPPAAPLPRLHLKHVHFITVVREPGQTMEYPSGHCQHQQPSIQLWTTFLKLLFPGQNWTTTPTLPLTLHLWSNFQHHHWP